MYTDYEEENGEVNNYDSSNDKDQSKLKKIAIYVLVFVVALILIILLFKGCSINNNGGNIGGNTGGQTPTIAINKQNITLEVGDEMQLYADVLMTDKKNPVVVWYSEDSSVASVNDDGMISANSEGTTVIVASYVENGQTYENKCNVVVTSKNVALEKINIQQENITLKKGNSVILQIETEPTDAKVEELIYTSDDPSIATVDNNGLVRAIKKGVTTITVKTSDSKLSDSVTINVTDAGATVINPVSLQLNTPSNTLKVGGTTKISFVITPSNATNRNITWTSTNPSVATVENGVVTAKKSGTTYIVANTHNNVSAKIKITVEENTIPVESIEIIGGNNLNLTTGQTKKINYEIKPSNATSIDIVYQSNNINVATVTSDGIITATGSGNAVITLKTKDGAVYSYINVTVTGTSNPSDDNTGSSSSGSSGSTSQGNGSTSSSSCTPYSMVTVTSGGDGVIYTELKDNMKVATNDVRFTITNVSSCLEKLEYAVNCSSQGCNYSTAKVGSSFKVTKNGTNTIIFRGTTKDGDTLNKYYFVKINKATAKPNFTVATSYTSINTSFTPTLTSNGSGNAYIYFCASRISDQCNITFTNTFVFQSGTTKTWSKASFDHVCLQAKDSSGNYSAKKCYSIKNGGAVIS